MRESPQEIERRYANVREAAVRDGLDAVVVSGSEYTGFEGAVRYLSGFRILHRVAYVVLPVDGDPSIVFPREARWVGDHGESWIEERVFAPLPGEWIADRIVEIDAEDQHSAEAGSIVGDQRNQSRIGQR